MPFSGARVRESRSGPEWMRENLITAVRSGITSIRDAGLLLTAPDCVDESLKDLEWARISCPARVWSPIVMLTRHGGHACEFGHVIGSLSDLPALLELLAARGASYFKVLNDPQVFSIEDIVDIVKQAEDYGLPVGVHSFHEAVAREAVIAGARTIEHMGDYSQATLSRMSENGTYLVTTVVAAFDTVADPQGSGADALFDDAGLSTFETWLHDTCACARKAAFQGVRLVAGTDAGFPCTSFDSLLREFRLLRAQDVPLNSCIDAVTVNPAAALNMEENIGVIRPGALADFCVYDSNPLAPPYFESPPSEIYIGGVEWKETPDAS